MLSIFSRCVCKWESILYKNNAVHESGWAQIHKPS